MLTPADERAIVGCLLGTAVGDALGLPCENLSPRRQRRLFPHVERHQFLFGHGMISDDTEHACMVAQALLSSGGDPGLFRRHLAWKLRWWFLLLPVGIGRATAKSVIKLWLGGRGGSYSAGNGPAMRAPLLGVCFGHDLEKLQQLVHASTLLTHTDPKAFYGSLLVALAAHHSARRDNEQALIDDFLAQAHSLLDSQAPRLMSLVEQAKDSAAGQETALRFADRLGLKRGVTGYVNHTVPVVLQTWFRCPRDPEQALPDLIRAGGDTDTTAAILGGIIGAGSGPEGIPGSWLEKLFEWPRTVKWMTKLGQRLAQSTGENERPPRLFGLGLLLRNLLFLVLVIVHVLRRLLPPW